MSLTINVSDVSKIKRITVTIILEEENYITELQNELRYMLDTNKEYIHRNSKFFELLKQLYEKIN